MLFTSKISLQPKVEVLIERKAPTKVFAKLFHAMTSGLLSPKEKHQTFTAISMLQELNIALRQANINNIVRLAKDGNDFYYDSQGRDNDLADAMRDFKLGTDRFEATLFNDIYLVLEHQDEQLRYLIEIDIQRVHKVDEMPININVNGVIQALKAQDGETAEQLDARLNSQFKNKQDYDKFVSRYRGLFDSFINSLEQTFRSAIRCEEVKSENKVQVIRPRKDGKGRIGDRNSGPMVHRGYPGWDGFSLYTLMWMGTMSSMNVQAADMDIINESNETLQSISDEAIDVGEAAIFDSSIDEGSLPSFMDDETQNVAAGGESSSWLDFGSGDGGDSGGDASCGGGCGGGCGG
jgi:hypothetical protein